LKGSSSNRIQKKRANERENKRRKTHLSSRLTDLGDALPETDKDRQQRSASSTAGAAIQMTMGLKTKPGHTKRLQKLKEMERARFAQNLGAMSADTSKELDSKASPEDSGVQSRSNEQQHSARWAALRAHITSQQAG